MKYTKFFGRVNKDNGLQRISNSQLARIMNVVYLEGRKRGVAEAIALCKKEKHTKSAELVNFKLSQRITEITGNREPNALMQEICYISNDEY